jgi:purine-binding chemotaxis protein CheW
VSAIDVGQCLVFSLDGQSYADRLSVVSRVVHAVEITPLPDAPRIILGIINIAGSIVPVIGLRRRFQLPERPWGLNDRLIVARASKSGGLAEEGRLVALAVDAVLGVSDFSGQTTSTADAVLPGLENLEGLSKTDLGIVLIYDLAMFLSLDEQRALEAVMREGRR